MSTAKATTTKVYEQEDTKIATICQEHGKLIDI